MNDVDTTETPPERTRTALAAWAGLVGAFSARAYLAFIVSLGIFATVPIMFGLSAVVIHGDSMRPFIGVGDVVLTIPYADAAEVPMGRVVEFRAPAGAATQGAVMHRIVAANKNGTLVTAGDGNTQFDTAPLDKTNIDALAVILVRWAGLPAFWAGTQNYVKLALWVLITGLAIAVEIAGLRRLHPSGRHVMIVPAAAIAILSLLGVGGTHQQDASAAFTAQSGNPGNHWAYPAAKAAVRLAFSTSPGNSTGGRAFSRQPVVTLLDSDGKPTTGIKTITLTLAGPAGGTFTCTANPVPTAHGIASFAGCGVDKVGTYTLVASTSSLPSVSSGSFTITAGTASRLAFSATPGTTAQATAFATQPAVRILDAGGNPTTSTAQVTLSLTSLPAGATLSCTQNPKAAAAGVATFAGCSVNKSGTYTLTARVSSVPDATSASFTISAPPALTCASTTWMATFSWSPTPYATTVYSLYVNGIKVQATGADGWNSYVQLTSNNVPASQFPAGTATVEVRKVLTGGTEQVVGTGKVVLGAANYRTYLCG